MPFFGHTVPRRTRASLLNVSAAGAVVLLATACGGSGSSGNSGADASNGGDKSEPTSITIGLGFPGDPLYAAAAVAVEQGFFAEENLDVEIAPGGGGVDMEALMVQGDLQFIFGSLGDLPIARDRGLNIRAVAGMDRVNNFGVVTAPGSGIEEPKDFEGKSVAMAATGGSTRLFYAFAKQNGVDISKVKVVTVEGPTTAALLSGSVDAGTGNTSINLIRAREIKPEVGFVAFKDWGVPAVGFGLSTTEEMIEKDPELVRRVVRAWLRGVEFTQENPEQAVSDAEALWPEGVGAYRDPLSSVEEAYRGAEAPWGYIPEQAWLKTLEILVDAGEITVADPVDVYYTTEFLPCTEEGDCE
jgi:NitT/TauT family transport system substrate-binding protein